MTEENFIDFKCPYCDAPVSFLESCAGFVQECPSCAESLIVPDDGSEVGRPLPVSITTPRLVLRRLSAGDWKDVQEILSDEEVFRYTEGRPLTEEEVVQWLESDAHVRLTTPHQPFCLGIEARDRGRIIGYLSLSFTDAQRQQARLHLLLGRRFQSQGFGAEAVAAAMEFCFAGIRLHRVTAQSDSRNLAACRLCEKAGLRREGEFVNDHPADGEWANTVAYALLREEYSVHRPAPPAAD
jgi:RimJ/RimL family protein N-acetyltransferase